MLPKILINGQQAELNFRPHAYKDGNKIIVKLSESSNTKEYIENEDIIVHKDVETGAISLLIINNFTDLENFK